MSGKRKTWAVFYWSFWIVYIVVRLPPFLNWINALSEPPDTLWIWFLPFNQFWILGWAVLGLVVAAHMFLTFSGPPYIPEPDEIINGPDDSADSLEASRQWKQDHV